jgi:hypothetical protein
MAFVKRWAEMKINLLALVFILPIQNVCVGLNETLLDETIPLETTNNVVVQESVPIADNAANPNTEESESLNNISSDEITPLLADVINKKLPSEPIKIAAPFYNMIPEKCKPAIKDSSLWNKVFRAASRLSLTLVEIMTATYYFRSVSENDNWKNNFFSDSVPNNILIHNACITVLCSLELAIKTSRDRCTVIMEDAYVSIEIPVFKYLCEEAALNKKNFAVSESLVLQQLFHKNTICPPASYYISEVDKYCDMLSVGGVNFLQKSNCSIEQIMNEELGSSALQKISLLFADMLPKALADILKQDQQWVSVFSNTQELHLTVNNMMVAAYYFRTICNDQWWKDSVLPPTASPHSVIKNILMIAANCIVSEFDIRHSGELIRIQHTVSPCKYMCITNNFDKGRFIQCQQLIKSTLTTKNAKAPPDDYFQSEIEKYRAILLASI